MEWQILVDLMVDPEWQSDLGLQCLLRPIFPVLRIRMVLQNCYPKSKHMYILVFDEIMYKVFVNLFCPCAAFWRHRLFGLYIHQSSR